MIGKQITDFTKTEGRKNGVYENYENGGIEQTSKEQGAGEQGSEYAYALSDPCSPG